MLLHPDTLTPYTAKHLLCLDNAASLQMFYNRIIHLGMFLFEHDDIKGTGPGLNHQKIGDFISGS